MCSLKKCNVCFREGAETPNNVFFPTNTLKHLKTLCHFSLCERMVRENSSSAFDAKANARGRVF